MPCGECVVHTLLVIKRVIIVFSALNGPILSTKATSRYLLVASCLIFQCRIMFLFILSQVMGCYKEHPIFRFIKDRG